ncbi:MAG: class I SAM-dependent methyltransferase [Candidatus Wallbacteria bacterium]
MKFFEPHESIARFINVSRNYFMEAYGFIAAEANEWFGLSRLSSGDKILEFGGGEGIMTINLAKLSPADFIFIEKNKHMADLARLNFNEAGISGRTEIMVGEVEDADIPSNSISFIISRGAIQFTDYKKTITNLVRWLKPGGIAYFGCGLGMNISDEYRVKMDKYFDAKKDKKDTTNADVFDEMKIEGYKLLIEKHFDDELEYVKAVNINGFFFEIKKSLNTSLNTLPNN